MSPVSDDKLATTFFEVATFTTAIPPKIEKATLADPLFIPTAMGYVGRELATVHRHVDSFVFQPKPKRNMVHLGFVEPFEEPPNYDLSDFPSKVGGRPLWLNPSHALGPEDLMCGSCNQIMVLLVQIYTTDDENQDAFHRVIYVFICKHGKCHKSEWKKSRLPEDYAQPSKAGLFRLYFDHQILDWKSGHKEACKSTISENPAASKDALFPETELVDEEEPDWKEEILKSAKEKYGTERELEGPEDSDEEEAVDTSIGVDKAFLKFQKRVGVAPDQVVRYGRTGWTSPEDPLYVSDLGKPENIPACSICRTPREFEFQLMPQLLNHLGINSYSPDALDWGTVLVYSCPRHCRIEIGAYQPEFIWRQDFSADGMVPGQLEEVKKEDEDDVK
ncbi:programmed cell death protein 2 [Cladochytrium replicatum]|nr:programmed cell death protein 2 [Cladochytrium replicatum]